MLILGGILAVPPPAFSSNNIIINEIAWMGTDISASDEWIELYNPTNQEVDLTGWIIKAADGTPKITLSGKIAAGGYFLLERTNDESAPETPADQIYTGALSNNGEALELYDAQSNLIEQVNFSDGWPAGDNNTKQTMERKDAIGWQASQNAGGTPKAKNSPGQKTAPEEPQEPEEPQKPKEQEPTEEQIIDGGPARSNKPPVARIGPDNITALTNQKIFFDASFSSDPNRDKLTFFWNFGDGQTSTEAKTNHIYAYPGEYIATLLVSDGQLTNMDVVKINVYSQSIIISEFLPNPYGNDEENEWIEIYNQSDQIANLANWRLDDEESGSEPFVFPEGSLIAPCQFLVIKRPISKVHLNNDWDQARLLYPDGSLASQIDYSGEDKEGMSVAFDGSDYYWTKTATPGAVNIISAIEQNEKQNIAIKTPISIIKTTKEIPETTAKNMTAGQNFSVIAPKQEAVIIQEELTEDQLNKPRQTTQAQTNPLQQQPASIAKTAKNNKKADLILVLSIIISGSLMISWGIIRIRNRFEAQ